jgi:cytochrome c oxidase subunit III
VNPAVDPVSDKRERDLNSLYRMGIGATLTFVTVTFAALCLVFVLRSRVAFNWYHIYLPPVLWLDTVLLLASSVTYEIGHRRLKLQDQRAFFQWTQTSAALGVLFLAGQFVAWWQILATGQLMRNNPHSTFFFLLSGMHGAHILVGLAGLAALLYRTREPASGPKWQMNTRVLANAVALFWHYLDVLWLILFGLLLLVRR